MNLYEGVGYFIEKEALTALSMREVLTAFPGLNATYTIDNIAAMNFLNFLIEAQLATGRKIIHYGEDVVFVGHFEVLLAVDTVTEDSSDREKIDDLLASEGYDFAINYRASSEAKLEAIDAVLRYFDILSERDIQESYYFLMPYPPSKF